MSGRSVREEVLRVLATEPDTRLGYLPTVMIGSGLPTGTDLEELLWGLVADGLVYLDPAGQMNANSLANWRWRLSRRGERAVEGGPWEPDDAEGFLHRLREETPGLNSLALRYVEQALGAFNAGCYLATSVMLGVASEAAFNDLASAFVATLEGAAATKARRVIEDSTRTYYARWVEFRKRLDPIRDTFPEGLGDLLLLDAVGDLLRVTRNEAGHPTGRLIHQDTARAHLQIAATYLSRMTALRDHFVSLAPPVALAAGEQGTEASSK